MGGLLVILVAALLAGGVTGFFAFFLGVKPAVNKQLPQEEVSFQEEYTIEDETQKVSNIEEYPLSPRLRFERSDTACYISAGKGSDTFPCKMERRLNGTIEEYMLYPTGALNRSIYNPAGQLLEITGLNPNDTVSFHRDGKNIWFFDGPDGTVSQLTAILASVSLDTQKMLADVIFYNPDGTIRECNCSSSHDCCTNFMYSLEGMPNTYCTMYSLDEDICGYKKQDTSPLPQEANSPQLPISSRLPAR